MNTLLLIVAITTAIAMARHTYVCSNQNKYRWVLLVTVLPIALAVTTIMAFHLFGKGYIAGIITILTMISIAIIPGAIFGWLCAGDNAKRTWSIVFPIICFIPKMIIPIFIGLLHFIALLSSDEEVGKTEGCEEDSPGYYPSESGYVYSSPWDRLDIDESDY